MFLHLFMQQFNHRAHPWPCGSIEHFRGTPTSYFGLYLHKNKATLLQNRILKLNWLPCHNSSDSVECLVLLVFLFFSKHPGLSSNTNDSFFHFPSEPSFFTSKAFLASFSILYHFLASIVFFIVSQTQSISLVVYTLQCTKLALNDK